MEENVNVYEDEQEDSAFDLKKLYTMLVLNRKWVLLSIIACLGLAFTYLYFATRQYESTAKILIKDEKSSKSKMAGMEMFADMANLGFMSSSSGIDNEIEIMRSKGILENAVRNLKMYCTYRKKDGLRKRILYKKQPITVDIEETALDTIQYPINLKIVNENNKYLVKGEYFTPVDLGAPRPAPQLIEKTITKLPATIKTKVGVITLMPNHPYTLEEGNTLFVEITPPENVAKAYDKKMSVDQSSKKATVAVLTIVDAVPQRSIDFLYALLDSYNEQANAEKNEVALRTEEFINERLEKITRELGVTDSNIEEYMRQNDLVEMQMSTEMTLKNANQYDKELIGINLQVELLNNLSTYLDDEKNKYNVIPSNIGMQDAGTANLISQYNSVALERNKLLRTASEESPAVLPLTALLDEMDVSIHKAMEQSKITLDIRRKSLLDQYTKSQKELHLSPEQQRVMVGIGRQQTVQTALFTMLLQKREENSISLSATADKCTMVEKPTFNGKKSPRGIIVMFVALIMGAMLPFGVLFVLGLMKYKVEEREDIESMTELPVIADIAVASDSAKTKSDLVVNENTNTLMAEIFRSLRTNVLFSLGKGDKVIMATSVNADEGKTFCAANLASSFALLGKKVVLVELDIRKPKLAEQFNVSDRQHGITQLLTMTNPNCSDVKSHIAPSKVNANLDLLLAGLVTANPAELVEREQLDTIINILKAEYDYIVIDSAPVGLVSDSLQIARVVDATIAVVRADFTPKSNITLIDSLANAGMLKNVSIILNGIDMSKKKHSFHYGFGKYAKYSGQAFAGNAYSSFANSHYGNPDDDSIKI